MRFPTSALMLLVLGASNPAIADCVVPRCRCMPASMMGISEEELPRRQVESAVAVFQATVERIDTTRVRTTRIDTTRLRVISREKPTGPIVASVRVHRVWKGAVPETVTVRLRESAARQNSCDLSLRAGATYLVFATSGDAATGFRTSFCSGTERAEDSTLTLRVLGEGRPPER